MLKDLLKIRHPIIQAPMAGSDNPEFVAAACNAGVLGSLGAQYRTPEEIKSAIAKIRSLTDKPFAVNLFALEPQSAPSDAQITAALSPLQGYYKKFGIPAPTLQSVKSGIDPEAQLQTVLEARVPVFSFTLGIPESRWLQAFKKQSTLLIGTATNLKEARALEAAGVDIITAQGSEAGGHRGTFIGDVDRSMIGLMALVPQLVDCLNVPVIAAGAIMDGRGMAAAFALGAQAVQLGTAFLTSAECPVPQAYKQIIREHDADDTAITKVFSGGAARGIENAFMVENAGKPLLPFPYHNRLTGPFRKIANQSGQIDYTNLWSGQAGRLARDLPISELIDQLMSEAEGVVKKMGSQNL